MISSEIWPGCAMVSLRWLFKSRPSVTSLATLFSEPDADKNEQYLAFRDIYEDLQDVTRLYMDSVVIRMPNPFLDQNRKLKRINPCVKFRSGDDPASRFYPYDTDES